MKQDLEHRKLEKLHDTNLSPLRSRVWFLERSRHPLSEAKTDYFLKCDAQLCDQEDIRSEWNIRLTLESLPQELLGPLRSIPSKAITFALLTDFRHLSDECRHALQHITFDDPIPDSDPFSHDEMIKRTFALIADENCE